MRYLLAVCWIDGNYESHNEITEYDDFNEAIIEFNLNCSCIKGRTDPFEYESKSIILIECESKSIIRQFIRKGDNMLLK